MNTHERVSFTGHFHLVLLRREVFLINVHINFI